MAFAIFRFYEELNDFIAEERRKQVFGYACAQAATVKNAMEALGVPHTEVELILVNGVSVDYSYLVRDGDFISVYPQFEALDITPLLKLRDKPLRRTRFIADAHLGRLAKYLRILGFDTLYDGNYSDLEIVRIATGEHRIVLTRDRALLMHKLITHGCYVHATKPREQLNEILARLDLYRSFKPFSRCLRCNEELEEANRESLNGRVPGEYDRFWTCRQCDHIYWQGSHWQRMRAYR
ncbi:MAG: Mut7-C RNAse domain-containing protein [Burkholderiales bacterium]